VQVIELLFELLFVVPVDYFRWQKVRTLWSA